MYRLLTTALTFSLLACTACATTSNTPDTQGEPTQTSADPVSSEGPATENARVVPVLRVEARGGMCADSRGCFAHRTLDSEGMIAIHSNQLHAEGDPDAPARRVLTSDERARIARALDAIDPIALEDGYGECCNAYVDGSDLFVSFFEPDGSTLREVRVTSRPDAPPALLELMASLLDLEP